MTTENKKFFGLLAILLIIVGILIFFISRNSKEIRTEMDNLSPTQIVEKIENGEKIVLYIGSETCSYCKELLPILHKAQTNLNFTTVYLNLGKVNLEEYQKLSPYLDKVLTANVNGESKTQEMGKFFVTPMVAVINDGKMIDGFIGGISYREYTNFLKDSGISK